jgi:predicted ester cyclase
MLKDIYRTYIACLNKQEWRNLGHFVDDGVVHNERAVGLSGYRHMLEKDFEQIPDLRFNIEMLIEEPSCIAARLRFDCSPNGSFRGLPVNGKQVAFAEYVFYRFRGRKIVQVWSMIDKAAIEAQLRTDTYQRGFEALPSR